MRRLTRLDVAALCVIVATATLGITFAITGFVIGAVVAVIALAAATTCVLLLARHGSRDIRVRRATVVSDSPASNATVASRRPTQTRVEGDAPLLSIVMPVFNVAAYLESAILSVLYQDAQDFELIIVDDASTDGSGAIIDMYAKLDPRIRVLRLEQNSLGGAGLPSNLGVEAARGRYLGFADSDDVMMRTAFSHMIELAERESADVVIGGFATFTDDDHIVSPAYDVVLSTNIRKDHAISATEYPELLSLSPVPWRKLYRTDFMRGHDIAYPEGDYFFEDNPLHWAVLSQANRVVLTEHIVSHHRMGRAGQTMDSAEYRKGSFTHHLAHALASVLDTSGERRDALLGAYLEKLQASRWVLREQRHSGAQAMLAKRFAQLFDKAVAAGARAPLAMKRTFGTYRSSYPSVDLTVVLSTHNVAAAVRRTLDSLLAVRRLDIDIIVVDDGSTDDTQAVLREYESAHGNIHVFTQPMRGAGRARNSVIPLVTGDYVLFMKPGDLVQAELIPAAVRDIAEKNADVMMFSAGTGADDKVAAAPDPTIATVAAVADESWNKLIRTDFLHDENIFFGGQSPYEDVMFHWQLMARARHMVLNSSAVIRSTKFAQKRATQQFDGVNGVGVHDALWFTDRALRTAAEYDTLRPSWVSFAARYLLKVRAGIDESLTSDFDARTHDLWSDCGWNNESNDLDLLGLHPDTNKT